MIKAKDLRQWNLIYTPDGVIDSVTDIAVDGSIMTLGFGQMYDLEPIPLTEEWLVKAGFEMYQAYGINIQEPDKFKYRLQVFNDFYLKFDTNFKGWFRIDRATVSKTCMYVHQLQNLYFALTGEELKLKNK